MVVFGNENILKGAEILAKAIATTLGPGGHTVVISNKFGQTVTKDGATVAKEVKLDDKEEQVGVEILREASEETARLAGDGTSTAAVLAWAIIKYGRKALAHTVNPISLKFGIDTAVTTVVKSLQEQAIDVSKDLDKLRAVATISANNDSELGDLLATTVMAIGPNGSVTQEDSITGNTYAEIIDGFTIKDRGYVYPSFINTSKNECILNDVRILLTDKSITEATDLTQICDSIVKANQSLLIIATEVGAGALAFLVKNKERLKACVIQCPSFGFTRTHIMEDIGIVSESTVFTESGNPLKNCTIGSLGYAKQVVVTRDSTVLLGCPATNIDRINDLKILLDSVNNETDKETLESRISNLSGKSAIIYIGGQTPTELKEKKDRVDDALRAIYSAVEEGVVPGGGVAYIRALKSLDSLKLDDNANLGVNVIKQALLAPFKQITKNVGVDGSEILATIKTTHLGYNAKTGEFQDLFEAGVIDPVKVSRIALEKAASVASTLLTTECILIE